MCNFLNRSDVLLSRGSGSNPQKKLYGALEKPRFCCSNIEELSCQVNYKRQIASDRRRHVSQGTTGAATFARRLLHSHACARSILWCGHRLSCGLVRLCGQY
ncbi:hypothetical protein RRG08_002431 [Elysia crispata]|uniref:Uncharacterized protein n=1 Tax=Elysia crispata TaxID=231223 RepID=A0AAE1A7P5_9GAST|nr:hypothetical protein RRG08_002431 [Elysia crispata]